MKYTFILSFSFCLSCMHSSLDKQTIVKHLKEIQNDSVYSRYPAKGAIHGEDEAVQIAEPILFDIYGEDHIVDQRPYQVNLIDSLWVINGTLPINYTLGGVFFIVLNSKDGKVLSISHGKYYRQAMNTSDTHTTNVWPT